MGQIAAGLHDQRAGAQEQRRPGRIGGRSHQHGPGRHGQPGGRIARHEGGAARMAGRHWRAAPSVGAGIDSGIRAARAQGPASAPPSLSSTTSGSSAPAHCCSCVLRHAARRRRVRRQRAVGQSQQFLDAQVEHIVGRGQAAGAGAAFAQRQRAAPGGGDVADQHAARGLALAAVQPRAGDQQPRQRLPARQRRVQRPPGRKRGGLLARTQRGRVGADQVQHAVQQIIRRFAPARMTQIGFRRRRDGRSAPGSARRRGGTAIWRQRVAPVRAAPVGCAQPGQRRRIVAPARPDPSARSSGRPSRWARRQP